MVRAKGLTSFKCLILGSCTSLSMEMFSKIVIRRFYLVYYISISTSLLESHSATVSLIEMICVVLLVMEGGTSVSMLILEYFR